MKAQCKIILNFLPFTGIGAAWNEQESSAYGIPFPSTKERFSRLEEAIQIIRKMWTEETSASFNGQYYQIKNAFCNPKTIQKPYYGRRQWRTADSKNRSKVC